VDQILAYARAKQDHIISLIKVLVETESPSGDREALDRFVSLFSDVVAPMASLRIGRNAHLRAEFNLPGPKKRGQILALGHSDTVWPVGTLARMPFRRGKGRLWGPGVLDMKSGLAFFVFALRAIRDLDIPVSRRVVLQLNSDEETGSGTSRALTEREAKRSDFVLVLEPGEGLDGKLKTARKGVGAYRLKVRGRASHAGVDFASGASAILELARQLDHIAGFTDLARGLTVNPGVISGGARSNVVAEHAEAEIDIRVARLKDAPALDRKFRALRPIDRRCALEIDGGLNRPPMERTPAIAALFAKARAYSEELGVKLDESSTGGGSDGNFTAALGVPTLDGLGGVGEGAHAAHESILIDRIAGRTALLAMLIAGASTRTESGPESG
jgi:glutamate carboxypeptidase